MIEAFLEQGHWRQAYSIERYQKCRAIGAKPRSMGVIPECTCMLTLNDRTSAATTLSEAPMPPLLDLHKMLLACSKCVVHILRRQIFA